MNAMLLESINRSCGYCIGYGAAPAQRTAPCGLSALDNAAGGGIPVGRIVEIFGGEASGKTALALHLAQQLPGPALFLDADHALSPHMLNGQDFYLLRVDTLEEALGACKLAIPAFKAIVIDTVTALPTREDLGTRLTTGRQLYPTARTLSHAIPVLSGRLRAYGCTLIIVNQMRNRPGAMYGELDQPTGGRAIGYYAALRLKTTTVEYIQRDGAVEGQKILVDVRKCKYGSPGRRAVLRLMYEGGLTN